MSVIETKIFIALTYYTLAGAVILADTTLLTSKINSRTTELQKYFICEGKGSGSSCDKSKLQQISTPWLDLTANVLLGLLPAVSLIFIISWKDVKRTLQEKWRKMIALLKEKLSKDIERCGSSASTTQFYLSEMGKSDANE